MKLLITITVAEYKERLQEFLSKYEVPSYNEIEMQGVRKLAKPAHRLGNWFGQETRGINNVAFIAVVNQEQGEALINEFSVCKETMPSCNIQAFMVDIEKGIF